MRGLKPTLRPYRIVPRNDLSVLFGLDMALFGGWHGRACRFSGIDGVEHGRRGNPLDRHEGQRRGEPYPDWSALTRVHRIEVVWDRHAHQKDQCSDQPQ